MSTILLNLDFGEPSKRAFGGNAKHQRFVKKRRFLEQRGFLNKKNQLPSKVSKLNSEPPKKGETSRVDGIFKILPCPKKKEAAASRREAERSIDKKASLSWLTPGPSKKNDSVVAKIDLLGEFQSALPKIKSHPSPTQKGSKKKPLKKMPLRTPPKLHQRVRAPRSPHRKVLHRIPCKVLQRIKAPRSP